MEKAQDTIVRANYTVSAKPLDFSFLKLTEIAQLRKEMARDGKRKPIAESDEEEDMKKNDGAAQIANVETGDEQKAQETKEIVIRAQPNQQITTILQQYNISLAAGAKGSAGGITEQKQEDAKVGEQKKFVVNQKTTALFLQQNQFRTLLGLSSVLKDVMWNSDNLLWIDLSYNYLERIEDEIVNNFPCLRTLYLHGCYISNVEEVKKLNTLPDLHTLTLYGNPIEQIKGYRMYVLGVMYLKSISLKKLDQVVITKKEFDGVCVWNEALMANSAQKLKKLVPQNQQNIKKVPPPKTEDDDKGKATAGVA